MTKPLILPAFIGVVTFVTLGGCAIGYAQQMPPAQQPFLKSVCTQITRVRTNAEMLGCEESLSDSMADLRQATLDAESDNYCAIHGLKNGTSEFAMCVLDHQRDSVAADPPPASEKVLVQANSMADEGWRFGTFEARHRREQLSCAQLGIDPGSQAFVNCVNGLDASLFSADDTSR